MSEPRIAVEIDMAPEVWALQSDAELSEEAAEELADQLAARVRSEVPNAELSMTRTVRMASGAGNRIATVSLAEDDTPTPQQTEAMRGLETQIAAWARRLLRQQR
ncbi:MAG: hypothetical protein GF393_04965 [Armatimonadia bacterium]|nr:hypothetical protein [Armatimonadia bacterium]